MIPSGTLHLSDTVHAAAVTSLRARLADLDVRRRSAADSIAQVLGSWRGEAADTFRERWEEWDRGAAAVIDSLASGVVALEQLHADLRDVDAMRASSAAHLGGRLG